MLGCVSHSTCTYVEFQVFTGTGNCETGGSRHLWSQQLLRPVWKSEGQGLLRESPCPGTKNLANSKGPAIKTEIHIFHLCFVHIHFAVVGFAPNSQRGSGCG